ncbi:MULTISPECIES: hypothetical protein [unclassified Sphingopyxis]|jgi:hypothetical protein|uniref:hypothetical protein n=1 Tax=unclassified Sphingopyxis TaxID=2614943 RepID=UPI002861B9BD|nr:MULTISPECIES: hypothetical protein [unclassified Sphingopyxis]MDR6832204.1 hypothetical protein [Sphingopyxis sp. BE122]MDR7227947.1 hypothetical protein [Sphingopyxis sp. BE259]
MMKKAILLLPLLAAFALAAPATAQDDSLAQSGQPPQRTSVLYTYGDEPCPEPVGDEIIVCAQQPESERYRVPKELREELKDDAPVGGGSWASTVEGYDNIARATRPNSCSPVGSYGFTGCASAALRQWFEARRAR